MDPNLCVFKALDTQLVSLNPPPPNTHTEVVAGESFSFSVRFCWSELTLERGGCLLMDQTVMCALTSRLMTGMQ